MDRRRKAPDPDAQKQSRIDFYEAIDRGDLTLQEAMKQMRSLSRLTQVEFAKHRGVSLKVIKEMEAGIANPTLKTLNQIAAIFGLEVRYTKVRKS